MIDGKPILVRGVVRGIYNTIASCLSNGSEGIYANISIALQGSFNVGFNNTLRSK